MSKTVENHNDEIFWTDLDEQMVRESRGISLEILKTAGSGHPGITLSMMPLLYLMYSKILQLNPNNPNWSGRDYFVLSCGHASLAQYVQLHLAGFDVSMEDLKQFRQLNSKTPGHPEYGLTPGVEMSTGPLGQGFAMSVGLALAKKYQNKLLKNHEIFQRNVFVLVSDGDTQEGIFAEAASLASLYQLNNLIVFFDSNQITIDGSTSMSANDEIKLRMESSGWDVHSIPPKLSGDLDVIEIWKTIKSAKQTAAPSFIILESTIGWPAPRSKGTSRIHGNLLSEKELAETQEILTFKGNAEPEFSLEAKEQAAAILKMRLAGVEKYEKDLETWFEDNQTEKEIWDLLINGNGIDVQNVLTVSEVVEKISTRKMNGMIIQDLKSKSIGCIGGSADLTESNSLSLENLFLDSKIMERPGDNFTFGVREHAMSAIINGFALAAATIPYCATYLVFSDYQKPAIRMAALMDLFVTYFWTHDSIAIGADGPTHQPIEQLAMLRAIPNFAVIRPADANELGQAWKCILQNRKPSGLVLSRQDLKVIRSNVITQENVAKGAYILLDSYIPEKPDVIVIASGSEVQLAIELHERMNSKVVGIRVVSMPCMEWFDLQPRSYKETVLPTTCPERISIEAGSTFGWDRYVGLSGRIIGIDEFGASGDGELLLSKFGISVENLENEVNNLLNRHENLSDIR